MVDTRDIHQAPLLERIAALEAENQKQKLQIESMDDLVLAHVARLREKRVLEAELQKSQAELRDKMAAARHVTRRLEAENQEHQRRWNAGFAEFLERIGLDLHGTEAADLVEVLNSLDELRAENQQLRVNERMAKRIMRERGKQRDELRGENDELRLRALPADEYEVFPDSGTLDEQITWLRENRNLWMQRGDELQTRIESMEEVERGRHRQIREWVDKEAELRAEVERLKIALLEATRELAARVVRGPESAAPPTSEDS